MAPKNSAKEQRMRFEEHPYHDHMLLPKSNGLDSQSSGETLDVLRRMITRSCLCFWNINVIQEYQLQIIRAGNKEVRKRQ